MTNTSVKINSREYGMHKVSVGMQTAAAIVATVSAVLLPQLLHMLGAATGMGSGLGETLLPMHLPVLLVGILSGTYAGVMTGLLAPMISYMLTGMPSETMLPFITIELVVYGICMGAFRSVKMVSVGKVLIAQFAGRAVRAIAILLSVYVFGISQIAPAVIWTSIKNGIAGIVIQLVLVPAIVYLVRRADNNDRELA